MSRTVNPNYFESAVTVRGRPVEHLRQVYRQGQQCRVIQVRNCPKGAAHGEHDMSCPLCHGAKFLYTFQKEMRVLEELHTKQDASNRIVTEFYPITEVEKVSRFISDSQGGNYDFHVKRFDREFIYLDDDNYQLPKSYEGIKLTYKVLMWEQYWNVYPTKKDNWTLQVDTNYVNSITQNPQNIIGDLAEITRVYNRTKDAYYEVDSFFRNIIIVKPHARIIGSDDIIECDYSVMPSTPIVSTDLKANDPQLKWGNVTTGDIESACAEYLLLKKYDIITYLFGETTKEDIIVKSETDIDFLSEFSILEIRADIIDEDGKTYKPNIDVIIYYYNAIKWIGNRPATGKQYTILFTYNPSYTVYDEMPIVKGTGNQFYPKMLHLKKYDKLEIGDLNIFKER